MSEIDYDALLVSILDNIDESLQSKYDFDTILKTATIVWDGTAVQVNASDFTMCFDLISYEIVDYTGNDINQKIWRYERLWHYMMIILQMRINHLQKT